MLENFRSFARAVEAGSFSEAGRRMRVSANVISQRIQALENHLGCRLFNRTTRNMGLTEQGRIFYDHVIDALHTIEMAEANIGELGAMPLGSIRVAAPLGLGRRLVGPTAAAYRDAHPQIDVQLRLSERRLDIIAESCDLALQFVTYADSSMIMRKIADAERVLCASPAYIERAGMPVVPADLARHQCLLLRFPGSREFRWSLSQDGEEISVPIKGSLDADDGDVLTAWALDGRGIVLKPVYEIADALAQGRLVPVLTANPPPPATLAVLYPTRNLVPLKVKAFADLLVERGRRFLATELARLGPLPSGALPLQESEA
ncbi:LysR substrate-binding domain-containing protein [Labrys neptuniae]